MSACQQVGAQANLSLAAPSCVVAKSPSKLRFARTPVCVTPYMNRLADDFVLPVAETSCPNLGELISKNCAGCRQRYEIQQADKERHQLRMAFAMIRHETKKRKWKETDNGKAMDEVPRVKTVELSPQLPLRTHTRGRNTSTWKADGTLIAPEVQPC